MKTLINYHDELYEANTTDTDYQVVLVENNIVVDQCESCGVWVDEDEEMYGDNYCTNCCHLCNSCMTYVSADSDICPNCNEQVGE